MYGITKVGNNDPKICNGDNISNSTFRAIICIATPCTEVGRGQILFRFRGCVCYSVSLTFI